MPPRLHQGRACLPGSPGPRPCTSARCRPQASQVICTGQKIPERAGGLSSSPRPLPRNPTVLPMSRTTCSESRSAHSWLNWDPGEAHT